MVAGQVTGESIVVPDKMLQGMGINVIQDEVTRIDAKKKVVYSSDGIEFMYDKLYMATGSSSFVPPIEGNDLAGVLTLRGLSDAAMIKDFLDNQGVKNIIFIGAGFISMEIASLIKQMGKIDAKISVIELMDRPLPLMLDKEMGDTVKLYLEEKGLNILTGEIVDKIVGRSGKVVGVKLVSGKTLEADVVFMNVGVRPNVKLAQDIGLEMGQFGIKVNEFQETSHPDILAGGDCVEKYNFITKKPTPGQLRGPAVVQGRLAAKRLAGYNI